MGLGLNIAKVRGGAGTEHSQGEGGGAACFFFSSSFVHHLFTITTIEIDVPVMAA